MRFMSLIILSLLITACAMGPDYTRPDVPVPDSFRMADTEETQSIANLPGGSSFATRNFRSWFESRCMRTKTCSSPSRGSKRSRPSWGARGWNSLPN